MVGQITHVVDPDDGHLTQIVTAAELRRILRADGETLDRPDDFGPLDEWNVDEDSRP